MGYLQDFGLLQRSRKYVKSKRAIWYEPTEKGIEAANHTMALYNIMTDGNKKISEEDENDANRRE